MRLHRQPCARIAQPRPTANHGRIFFENNTGSTEITVNEQSSGCGSCTVSTRDSGGGMLLSLSVLSVLMWRRRSSNVS
jgi:hypothetical protein